MSLTESEIIAHISDRLRAPQTTRLSIGDDAAWLNPGFDLAACDTQCEGVHFSFEYMTWGDVAFRTLASNLSDIAAMGGSAGPFLLSLALPTTGITAPQLADFIQGLLDAIAAHSVRGSTPELVGGDVVCSPGGVVLTITQLGRSPTLPLRRSGAKAGDRVVVFAELGNSAAGLEVLRRGLRETYPQLAQAHLRPVANLALAGSLAESGEVHAMIDLSDGLSRDLLHVLEASTVGAQIELESLPISEPASHLAQILSVDPIDWAVGGGEDYALCAMVAPDKVQAVRTLAANEGCKLYVVGTVTHEMGLRLCYNGLERPNTRSGYEHFKGST